MNLLVVGGGGREHTIIKKLKENPAVETIYAVPGNGGIAEDAICVPEIGATKIDAIVEFAKAHAIDFAVVAPDDPLALGCVDRLHEAGIPCFGPDAKAARIEASKVFSKNLMKKYNIPTAEYEVFTEAEAALKAGTLKVFDVSTFTAPAGASYAVDADGHLTSAFATDTNGDWVADANEVVIDGYFSESSVQSAPYFSIIIDGITAVTE